MTVGELLIRIEFYKTFGMLSTDCKNKLVRDRFDYKNLVDCKVQNFENLNFCCRLETTNWSVLNFPALRAATFIKKYIHIHILVYPGYAKDELKNSDTWTAKIGVNTAENNNSIDNSSNYCH